MRWIRATILHGNLPMSYPYLLEIKSEGDMLEYLTGIAQKHFDAGVVDVFTTLKKKAGQHCDTPFGNYAHCLMSFSGKSTVGALMQGAADITSVLRTTYEKHGIVYAQEIGSFFGAFTEPEVHDEVPYSPGAPWPQVERYTDDDIRLTQWTGGSHWYARVGSHEVEVSGETKWATANEAATHAEAFMLRLNKEATPCGKSD